MHGLAGVWGTLSLGLFALPSQADSLATGTGGLVYTGSLRQLGTQALGLAAVGAFTFTASFVALWAMKRTAGIRVEERVDTAGLDVSEHGMWGYPEFYIPVPGGYGTSRTAIFGPLTARATSTCPRPSRCDRRCRSPRLPDRLRGGAVAGPPLRTMAPSPGRRRCRG